MATEAHNSGGHLELWKRVVIAALWPVTMGSGDKRDLLDDGARSARHRS